MKIERENARVFIAAASGRAPWLVLVLSLLALPISPAQSESPPHLLLWGDTHLHTSLSFDAFMNNNLTADPDTAYRFARGLPVIHPYNRTRVQLDRALDFLVVSDHAEFLGALRDIYHDGLVDETAGPIDSVFNWVRTWIIRNAIDKREGMELFADRLPEPEDAVTAAAAYSGATRDLLPGAQASMSDAWREITAAAQRHYQPGEFTTLIGWEWSSIPGGANLHRIVISDIDAAEAGQFLPFGSDVSPYPEDLWQWLDTVAADTGAEFLAIPHNSNISKGMMFSERTLRGEPVAEATQIKGDSETHPALSPEDEFADFETYPHYIQRTPEPYRATKADFIRSGLKTGLELQAVLGVNPYQFGLIGSTDAHSGLASADENNFWGKMATDSIPENKTRGATGATGWSMSASGLAAVWSESNDRESIVAAFRRREVYATTGPRMQLRFFAGWDYSETDLQTDVAAAGYAGGVPMGGVLEARPDQVPGFLVMAMKDPLGANLDRVQVVKGWLDATGSAREQVYDVAWSPGRVPGSDGRLPSVGNTVDLQTAVYRNEIGAASLQTFWQDPDYVPGQSAFYYARVLQIPTPRHALYDAIALGIEAPSVGPLTIQERAYSSPVWINPQGVTGAQ
jgi:hypothetical protein